MNHPIIKKTMFFALAAAVLFLAGCSIRPFDGSGPSRNHSYYGDRSFYGQCSSGNTVSSLWLADVMDKYHSTFDVYSDSGAGGNNFVILARMGDSNISIAANDTNSPYSGDTAIKVVFSPGTTGTGSFLTSTLADGTNPNTQVIMVNGETFPLLAITNLSMNYTNSLKFIDGNFTNGSANRYDYNTDKDGGWMEGTGFAALAYLFYSNITKGTNIIHGMTNGLRGTMGSVYASTKDQLTTGFYDYTGTNLYIYKRESLAATSLAIIADKKKNPFWIGTGSENVYGTAVAGNPNGYAWLTNAMDQYHLKYYVYYDANSGGNHFDYRGWDFDGNTNGGWNQFNVTVDEQTTNSVSTGTTSIKVNMICTQTLVSQHYFGIFYLNGVLTNTNRQPTANWGTYSNAGVNLTGAVAIYFTAKGASGGENVKFTIFGVARNPDGTTNTNGGAYWPDSCTSLSTNIKLTTSWTTYKISFSSSNISNVLNGFAYFAYFYTNSNYIYTDWGQTKTNFCNTSSNITIYVDNIFYSNYVTTNQSRLIKSFYVTPYGQDFDKVMGNMAYTYDNALAALAFLSVDDTNRAKRIVDALVQATTNDRYYTDNRLRNAYQSGDLTLPNGWYPNSKTNTIRMPGWWDNPHTNWYEDCYAVGTSLDTMAWAGLAIVSYYQKCGGADYLTAAQNIANFCDIYLKDTVNGGYRQGYYGWEPSATADTSKSVMANSAMYALTSRLYSITGIGTYGTDATSAKNFILSMWSCWSGFYFMNGQLPGSGSNMNQAITNWGYTANAGINLSDATKIEFYAKGAAGGEQVEFFMGGIGTDPVSGYTNAPYPDTCSKVSTGTLTLTSSWTKYTIDLTGKDLSYVLGGFGFAVNSASTNQVTFYLDDIKYDKSRLSSPRLLTSFMADQKVDTNSSKGSDLVLKNSAFVYDNAMSVLAFLAVGENTRAQQICDALVYARTNDRYYTDGRLRNAYSSGELYVWPGWYPNNHTNAMRMPGWWNTVSNSWYEDRYAVSTATGNIAWAMIALISYYQKCGGSIYLDTAIALGDWVYTNMYSSSGKPGFQGGYDGWEPSPTLLTWKSTEHNLDLYAAYKRLYGITSTAKWNTYAGYAYTFVTNMWQTGSNWFYTGTTSDGSTIDYSAPIPLDAQVWTHLSLHDLTGEYTNSLFVVTNTNGPWYWFVSSNSTWGFDFDKDHDGMWFEGTGQVATAFMLKGFESNATKVWNAINTIGRQADNGIVAATKDGLTTGFECSPGIPWYYYNREAVAPTSWAVMVEKRKNAYYIGDSSWEDLPVLVNTNTYGIFTETQAHSNQGYVFSTGGALAFWYGCGAWDTNNMSSGDGTNCWTVNVWVTDWFGWGVYKSTATNMSDYSGGFLSFKVKSWSAVPLKVGIKSTGQEAWKNLSDYGFQTNDTWQTINIPMSAFTAANPSLNFSQIEYFFMMAQAGTPVTNCNYYIDDIYWGYTY